MIGRFKTVKKDQSLADDISSSGVRQSFCDFDPRRLSGRNINAEARHHSERTMSSEMRSEPADRPL